jgi:hypothetical protein
MSYYEDAVKRTQRRRSPWNLLLIPAAIVGVASMSWILVDLFNIVHTNRHPGEALSSTARGLGPILVTIASFLAALPLGFLFANSIVRLVRPARIALDAEAQTVPGTDLRSSQRKLLRASTLIVPIALGLGLLGALLSWHFE